MLIVVVLHLRLKKTESEKILSIEFQVAIFKYLFHHLRSTFITLQTKEPAIFANLHEPTSFNSNVLGSTLGNLRFKLQINLMSAAWIFFGVNCREEKVSQKRCNLFFEFYGCTLKTISCNDLVKSECNIVLFPSATKKVLFGPIFCDWDIVQKFTTRCLMSSVSENKNLRPLAENANTSVPLCSGFCYHAFGNLKTFRNEWGAESANVKMQVRETLWEWWKCLCLI